MCEVVVGLYRIFLWTDFPVTPVCNYPDTCDIACMLQTLLQMLLLAVHANISLETLFEASHLFSNAPLYGHVLAILILTNCYGITNFLL